MESRETTGPSTILVGIDAACRGVLDPLIDDGVVPNLAGLLADGASGPLESQIPPWTASAWPSMYTGTNPGKHGVFDFLSFDGYDWGVVNATHVDERPLWSLLDRQDRTSVVVNVPVTHPPEEFDGALVPGYVAPEDPDCHPAGVLDDVREAIGEYRVYPKNADSAEGKREAFADAARSRGEAFRYLVDRFDPEFGFVEFQSTDTVFHDLPGDQEAVRAVYEAVDEQLGAILAECDPDTVVVASDHGMGPYRGHEFRVNEFLRESDDVTAVKGGEGMPTWATVRDGQLKEGQAETDPDSGAMERVMAALAGVGLTSQRIGKALDAVGLADAVAARVPTSMVSAGTEQVDFPSSRAYMRSRIECGVRINLEGREPDGVVPADRYEAVRDDLIDRLSSVRTPDGDPLFDDVARREKYFEGPHADDAVDVVTVPSKFDHFLSAKLRGSQWGEPSEPWNHKRDGIVALAGEGVDESAALGDAHLFDVAPTVLATMGVPADERMDGTVLPAVESAGERSYPEYSRRSTATDDEAVEDRLSNLGYIE
ncbi:phosphodiesterase [Halostella sp. JP-L12]|uniref:alkaline phosphatase family protein n=1 Tax=Halostella TaxID=1843185 RepID=UPI000EF7F6A1|nr:MULTISPECIES: alkaline phosphatase family protein [Halostella]NHN49808.1 phosphodiesterase [Halostella sp. JP-L12]